MLNKNNTSKVRIKDLVLTFLKIGAIGFGGGVGMLALIRRYLIAEKKWITDDDLATAVALGQTIPGPFIPNYVEYIGYRLRGFQGLFFSVIAFLIPGVLSMLVLSYLYFYSRQVVAFNQIFVWIQPVIIGILAWASVDMGKLYWIDLKSIIIGVFAFSASFLKVSPVITILICGSLGIVFFSRIHRVSSTTIPFLFFIVLSPFSINLPGLLSVFLLFAQIGTVIFGGGFAAIPFIAKEVTVLRSWLTNQELLTGIALSQITPGPVALLATFVGFRVSGIIGALIATIAIFLPSTIILILILMLYKYIKKSTNNKFYHNIRAFINGIKPAIVGFLIFATISLAISSNILTGHTIGIRMFKILIVMISFVLLVRVKISPVWLILGGAILGFILTRATVL